MSIDEKTKSNNLTKRDEYQIHKRCKYKTNDIQRGTERKRKRENEKINADGEEKETKRVAMKMKKCVL